MKHERTIQKALKQLRAECIEQTHDPLLARVAYAMETAIQWARTDTRGWLSPAQEARVMAQLIANDLSQEDR
jgi:hypothetical protein